MKQEGFLTRLLYFLRTVLLIDLGVFSLVAALCLLFGWRTLNQYGQALVWAGLAACLVGVSSLIRSLGLDRSFDYQYAQSVGQQKIDESVKQAMKEAGESHAFLALLVTVGMIAFAAGALIQSLS